MPLGRGLCALLLAFGLIGTLAGCGGEDADSKDKEPSADAHDDHHHHDHDGPHGGILFELEPADYAAEWALDSRHQIVRVYILDADTKEESPVALEKVLIHETKGREPQTFELLAELENGGLASVFAIKSAPLAAALTVGVDVEFELDGVAYTGQIEPHAPHDH